MTLWEGMLKNIEKEFQHKEKFLQEDTISKAINPNNT